MSPWLILLLYTARFQLPAAATDTWELNPYLVRIYTTRANGAMTQCDGILTDPNAVITDRTCIDEHHQIIMCMGVKLNVCRSGRFLRSARKAASILQSHQSFPEEPGVAAAPLLDVNGTRAANISNCMDVSYLTGEKGVGIATVEGWVSYCEDACKCPTFCLHTDGDSCPQAAGGALKCDGGIVGVRRKQETRDCRTIRYTDISYERGLMHFYSAFGEVYQSSAGVVCGFLFVNYCLV